MFDHLSRHLYMPDTFEGQIIIEHKVKERPRKSFIE